MALQALPELPGWGSLPDSEWVASACQLVSAAFQGRLLAGSLCNSLGELACWLCSQQARARQERELKRAAGPAALLFVCLPWPQAGECIALVAAVRRLAQQGSATISELEACAATHGIKPAVMFSMFAEALDSKPRRVVACMLLGCSDCHQEPSLGQRGSDQALPC